MLGNEGGAERGGHGPAEGGGQAHWQRDVRENPPSVPSSETALLLFDHFPATSFFARCRWIIPCL